MCAFKLAIIVLGVNILCSAFQDKGDVSNQRSMLAECSLLYLSFICPYLPVTWRERFFVGCVEETLCKNARIQVG